MFPPFPELKQRNAKPETPIDMRSLKQPVQSGAKIIMLDIAPSQPGSPAGFREVGIPFLSQDQAIGRMSAPRWLLLTAVGEALQAILPNGFEHPKTRFAVKLL